jgi:hypothetical protein
LLEASYPERTASEMKGCAATADYYQPVSSDGYRLSEDNRLHSIHSSISLNMSRNLDSDS